MPIGAVHAPAVGARASVRARVARRGAMVAALGVAIATLPAQVANAVIVGPFPDDYQPMPGQVVIVTVGCDPSEAWVVRASFADGASTVIDFTGVTDAAGADTGSFTVPASMTAGTSMSLNLWCGTTTPFDSDPSVELSGVGMVVAGAPFLSFAPASAAPGDTLTANLQFCDPGEPILFRLFNPIGGLFVDQTLTADGTGGYLGAEVAIPTTGYAPGDDFGLAMFCGGVETEDPSDFFTTFGTVVAAETSPSPSPPVIDDLDGDDDGGDTLAETGPEFTGVAWAAAALLGAGLVALTALRRRV